MNSVCLAGYLGADPKVYNTKEAKVAKFSLGTKAFKADAVDWHSVEAFKNAAEYIDKFVRKGDYLVVTGFLSTTEYTDKNGNQVRNYHVIALNVEKPSTRQQEKQQERVEDSYDLPY